MKYILSSLERFDEWIEGATIGESTLRWWLLFLFIILILGLQIFAGVLCK